MSHFHFENTTINGSILGGEHNTIRNDVHTPAIDWEKLQRELAAASTSSREQAELLSRLSETVKKRDTQSLLGIVRDFGVSTLSGIAAAAALPYLQSLLPQLFK